MRDKRQALVELDSPESAALILSQFKNGYITIHGRRVYFGFSVHRHSLGMPSFEGHVLLVSLSNADYNIRDVVSVAANDLHGLFSPCGTVHKVMILRKNSTETRQQALVQYNCRETCYVAFIYLHRIQVPIRPNFAVTLDIQSSRIENLKIITQTQFSRVYLPPLPAYRKLPQQRHHRSNSTGTLSAPQRARS